MREAVLLDGPDVLEAGLLERTPGTAVRFLDGCDDGVRIGIGEDDLARELRQNRRPEPPADQIRLADEEVDSGDTRADTDDLFPVGMIRHQVGLDHSDRTVVDDDQEVSSRVPTVECCSIFRDRLGDVVPPPAGDVLQTQPPGDERNVGLGQRSELDPFKLAMLLPDEREEKRGSGYLPERRALRFLRPGGGAGAASGAPGREAAGT